MVASKASRQSNKLAARGASNLSMLRTAVICAIALGFGILSSRGNWIELRWLAYAAVGLGTLKLFLENLRFGNAYLLSFRFSSTGWS